MLSRHSPAKALVMLQDSCSLRQHHIHLEKKMKAVNGTHLPGLMGRRDSWCLHANSVGHSVCQSLR